MSIEDSATKVACLVPEVYVDLIRRAIPGITFLISSGGYSIVQFARNRERGWSIVGEAARELAAVPATTQVLLLLLFLMGGYVTGMLFDSISSQITYWMRDLKWYRKLLWSKYSDSKSAEWLVVRQTFELGSVDPLTHDTWQAMIRDYSVAKNAYARAILPKVTAEEFLYKNLAIAGLVWVGVTRFWQFGARPSLLLAAILLILFWAGFVHRAKQTTLRVKSLFELTAKEHGLPVS